MIKKILTIIAISLTLTSCSDWLTLEPVDEIVGSKYWQSKEDVESTVIGCYSSLLEAELMYRMYIWGELRADLTTVGTSANSSAANIVKGEISTENGYCNWSTFYKTINQCNDVLENAPAVQDVDASFSDELLAQYEAEALALRAMMYFYLVRSFRDVPFSEDASSSDLQDFNLPKTEGTKILERLVSDLKTAINNLPLSYGNNDSNKGRITQWSAKTLLADIYLWQENYQGCADLCTQIIGSGQYSLIPVSKEKIEVINGASIDSVYHVSESDVNLLFDKLYVTGNSIESIFEIQYPKTHETLTDPFYTIFNGQRPFFTPNIEVVSENIFPEYTGDDRDVYDIRGNSFSYKGSYIWKWVGLERSSSTAMRPLRTFPHWIVYRYPEVLLMKAEALTQLAKSDNDQAKLKEAYGYVKQVRERSNAIETPETQLDNMGDISAASLEKLIYDERGREFAFEGKRWYDTLRHAKRDNFSDANFTYLQQMAINAAPSDKLASLLVKYRNEWFCYWPILQSVVEANPNLVQNPYYATTSK
ncbi:RagB/SusD family nutrient uptake outer membrane protein [Dysgonomonas macrotermitis]|uniref:Starch-binding associating with outer membrane n=1 Tax=Dysgonomonas macrotermitis TaxID=1346286 RepID=A0A1M4XB13_9BACT|nr:RagB/SusD family nutrient uptake outer membrane protein [Dysgonomonas macrotermitis]SHE90595.1 Starch-binding associating with outer membrane [Dysgonomonas macrotermitis]